jgi:hypothetical protein
MELNYQVTNNKAYILRIKKNNPGTGQVLGQMLGADQLVCDSRPARSIRANSVVINYGRSKLPVWARDDIKIFNHPANVAKCVDKRVTLSTLKNAGVPCLVFTEDESTAKEWLKNGHIVVVRAVVNGKGGNGVSLTKPSEQLPSAPLYTFFYDKTHEFRVHICRDKDGVLQVIDFVEKKKMGKEKLKKLNLEKANDLVRNHKRGWVFAHNDLTAPKGSQAYNHICEISLNAAEALGMDFCAVDILSMFTEDKVFKNAVICEVNSAPGMSSPTTLGAYVEAFKSIL